VMISNGSECGVSEVTIYGKDSVVLSTELNEISCVGFEDGEIILTPSEGNPNYTYKINGITQTDSTFTMLGPGYYQCIVIDGRNCKDTANVSMLEPDTLKVFAQDSYCVLLNSNHSIEASAQGGTGDYTIHWDQNSYQGNEYSYYFSSEQLVDVYATDENNCFSDTIQVASITKPQANFSISDSIGCAPLCTEFSIIKNPLENIDNFTWKFLNTSSQDSIESNCFNNDGEQPITLIVQSVNDCIDSLTKVVLIEKIPTAKFEIIETPNFYPNSTIHFKNLSLDATNYKWNYHDITSSFNELGEFLYDTSGVFNIQLLASSNFGCIDSITKTIEIIDRTGIFAPNAFTPNGDGDNDYFQIITNIEKLERINYNIYNRWGVKVFESDNINAKWDGLSPNGLVSPGMYVYSIDYLNPSINDIETLQGKVFLIK